MSPNKYKQGKIKTRNQRNVTHERSFNLVWRQIFQGTMWALCVVKLDVGGKATLETGF